MSPYERLQKVGPAVANQTFLQLNFLGAGASECFSPGEYEREMKEEKEPRSASFSNFFFFFFSHLFFPYLGSS